MMIVPQEISLANIMHVPPQYGLYTTAPTPVLYALFGSSPVLSVANGAEVGLMVGTVLQTIQSEQERIAVGIFLSFYIGLINVTLGSLRLGMIADFFSCPVLGGFLSAGGVLIMLSQLGSWFQLTLPSTSYPLETVWHVFHQRNDIKTNSVVVGAGSIAVLSLVKYAKRHWVPSSRPSDSMDKEQPKRSTKQNQDLMEFCDLGPLVVCVLGITAGLSLGESSIKVIGYVPQGLPAPVLPWYGYTDGIIKSVELESLTVNALSIALVVYMTSIAMTKRLAAQDHGAVNSSQELIGLGMASAVGAVFQAMPPTGGMSRTAVNMQLARTQLASIVTSGLVVVMLLVGTDALFYLPKATLAAIIIVAGFDLIEIHEAKWLFETKRDEFYVWLASFASTICLGIFSGLLASILWSLVALMVKTKQPHVYLVGRSASSRTYVNADEAGDAWVDPDIVVVRVQGSLYFGNCDNAMQSVLELAARHDKAKTLVLDASYIHDMDATTLGALEMLHSRLLKRGVQLAIANCQPRLATVLKCCGMCAKLSHPDVTSSIDATKALLRSHV